MTTREEESRARREGDTWSSPLYPAVFGFGFVIEFGLWNEAPYMQLGWMAVLSMSLVLASIPWIGSIRHRAESQAMRRHAARFAFLLPALLLHAGAFALYGPERRSGSGDSSVKLDQVLMALVDRARMPSLLVPAAGRPEYELRFLLRLGADVNAADVDGRYALDLAIDPRVITLLLDHGARAHSPAVYSTLWRLANAGEAQVLRRLLAAGVGPDTPSPSGEGYTAAHEAAYMNHADALRALLEAGADPWRRTTDDESVADRARRGGAEAALEVLGKFDARLLEPKP